MTTRNFSFVPLEFYHIYNRGTDKRVIYKTPGDHRRFQELLYVSNGTKAVALKDIQKRNQGIYEYDRGESLVAIGAYCLMPNHFHILLTPLVEGGVAKFMMKLTTGYSMYFNKKYERTGRLFEGSYKSKHADSDQYLKYLFSYIHLNPVKLIQQDWKERGIADIDSTYEYLNRFPFSSFCDYQNVIRPEGFILSTAAFPDYFEGAIQRKEEMLEWLTANPYQG